MKKTLLLLAMLVGVLIMSSFEKSGDLHFVKYKQGHIVSGRVTDCTDGVGIPGVNVTIVGTTAGVTTDANGNYSIMVPNNSSYLRFSYVGATVLVFNVGSKTTFSFCMKFDEQNLSMGQKRLSGIRIKN